MRIAKVITLTDEERVALTKWSRGRSTPARLVLRAKIVLAAASGRRSDEIAAELKCTRRTVGTWRNRFVSERLAGIEQDARGNELAAAEHGQDGRDVRTRLASLAGNCLGGDLFGRHSSEDV